MFYKEIEPFIIEEKENYFVIDVWNPKLYKLGKLIQKTDSDFEQYLSKLMEFERACVDKTDSRPIVRMRKDFFESIIELPKQNGEILVYTLHPSGFNGQWEIFKVDRTNI